MHKIIVVCLSVACFSYGLAVGLWRIPPYRIFLEIKLKFTDLQSADYSYSPTVGGKRILISDSSRMPIDCPRQTGRMGVLVVFGQSNAANYAEHRYKPEEVPNVINWFGGECYIAQSPLLGASNAGGEWMSMTAQLLTENGTYDKVIVVSLAIGGTPVSAWAPGGVANEHLIKAIHSVSEEYLVTDVVWHQGETDLKWGVGRQHYQDTFDKIHKQLRKYIQDAPVFMSIASYCNGGQYPNQITKSQLDLIRLNAGIELGVNTDLLVTPSMRRDDCHFNFAGQTVAAKSLAAMIKSYHRENWNTDLNDG